MLQKQNKAAVHVRRNEAGAGVKRQSWNEKPPRCGSLFFLRAAIGTSGCCISQQASVELPHPAGRERREQLTAAVTPV